MIPPQSIQQIQSRIDIIDIIGEFLKLKKRGVNYIGNCPFHGEKTPSFTVSPTKEIFKCFGCGKSGNAITFLMEHEKISYVEALRWLAKRYNVDIEETQVTDEVRQQQQAADSLYILNQFAKDWFQAQLWNTEEGQHIALSYLEERGFSHENIRKFQIGYNPQGGQAFAKAAAAEQFTPEVLLKAGLVNDRNQQLNDNYRGRIIFPIVANNGKIVGFGARVIGKADKAPKYINTPENDIYHKSRVLYGLYQARLAIDRFKECLLVEGYTDVTSLHQAGIENVVASGGTALTVEQLRLIQKYTNNLTIIYDGDAAGVKAAMRGLDMAVEEGLNVKLVLIPDNEDPDSYVKKVGEQAFRDFVAAQKKDFIIFQLEVMLKDAGSDIAKRNEAVNVVAETLAKITKPEDFLKLQDYTRQCAAILKIDEGGLTQLVNKYKRDKLTKEQNKLAANTELPTAVEINTSPESQAIGTEGIMHQNEINLMRVLLEHGHKPCWDSQYETVAHYLMHELGNIYVLHHTDCIAFLEAYINLFNAKLIDEGKAMLNHPNQEIQNMAANLMIHAHEQVSPKWEEKVTALPKNKEDEYAKAVTNAVYHYKLRRLKHIHTELLDQLANSNDLELFKASKDALDLLLDEEKKIAKMLGTAVVK
jgi:DNA primase